MLGQGCSPDNGAQHSYGERERPQRRRVASTISGERLIAAIGHESPKVATVLPGSPADGLHDTVRV
jgi:hypothetical protein